MAQQQPMQEGAHVLVLEIPGALPQSGDVYTYLATRQNAALAIAARCEDVDASAEAVRTLTHLKVSPMYQAAKQSLERDLLELQRTQPADAGERLDFVLDLFAARLFLAGSKLAEVA